MTGTAVTGALGLINSGVDKKGISNLAGFSQLNAADLGRFNKLLGGLAGESVNYAFTGDFNLNVLNASLFTSFTSKNISMGLLEMQLGKNGFGMNIGTGGVNISPDELYHSGGGALVWGINTGIDIFARKADFKAKATLRAQYGFGGSREKEQLWDILSGRANLVTDDIADYTGKTELINGKRTIHLGGYSTSMSIADQMTMATVLGHEAYRDGIVTNDNDLETQAAVLAHTKMAAAMILGGQKITLTDNLIDDLMTFVYSGGGGDGFNAYVNGNYDSSGDYWLLKKDGTVVDDDSADLHWEAITKDGGARYKTIWRAGEGVSKEESLVALLGGNETARKILADNGIKLNGNETAGEIGALIMANFTNSPENGGSLNLDYSQFNFDRDWLAIYNSYSADGNAAFFKKYEYHSNNDALLKTGNFNEPITDLLEYYAMLYDPLKNSLPLAGTEYENDPLGYLQANTSFVNLPGTGTVRVNNDMIDGLLAAYAETKAQGGVVPKSAAGLVIRFMHNDKDELLLSFHATGHAVDFDTATNQQYFLSDYTMTDPVLDSYLRDGLGVNQ
jgi:hypothetical protein